MFLRPGPDGTLLNARESTICSHRFGLEVKGGLPAFRTSRGKKTKQNKKSVRCWPAPAPTGRQLAVRHRLCQCVTVTPFVLRQLCMCRQRRTHTHTHNNEGCLPRVFCEEGLLRGDAISFTLKCLTLKNQQYSNSRMLYCTFRSSYIIFQRF